MLNCRENLYLLVGDEVCEQVSLVGPEAFLSPQQLVDNMNNQLNTDSFNDRNPGFLKRRNPALQLAWYERLLPCFWYPMELANACGMIYTMCFLFVIFAANAFATCPLLYGAEYCEKPILFGYFIIGQALINYALFHYYKHRNSLSTLVPGRMNEPLSDKSETKYCFTCCVTVPLRCHHCPLCHECVLSKDHHCFILGGCIGFGNHRFFMCFLFWACIGCIYGCSFTFSYLNHFYKPFLPWGWIDYLGPVAVFQWLCFQHTSLWNVALVMILTFGVSSICSALGFFISQWFFILQGYTMYEYFASRKTLKATSARERLLAIFGPYWPINFICPFPIFENKLDAEFRRSLFKSYLKQL